MEERYTYADYRKWAESGRWEFIDGKAYSTSFSQTEIHQTIIGELFLQLRSFLQDSACKVFMAPFDVRLNPEGADDTVVQLDIIVVCDKSKLDGNGVLGAPDLIVEVLSISSVEIDTVRKYKKYMSAGVKEYWIIDPLNKVLMVYTLKGGKYKEKPYFKEETNVPVATIKGCKISLADVFREISYMEIIDMS